MGLYQVSSNYSPGAKFDPRAIIWALLVEAHQESYVLNQLASIVMFGMKEFYVSASGAIQGHHGPLFQDILRPLFNSRELLVYM